MFRVYGPHTPPDYYLLSITIDCYRFLFIVNNCCRTLAGSRPYSWAVWEFWFNGSMVQSICDCSAVQSAVCLSKCLAVAPVFLLVATHYFVLFSCKLCRNRCPWDVCSLFKRSWSAGRNIFFRFFFFILGFKISYSEYSFVTDCYLGNKDCNLHKWTACAVRLPDLWINKFWPLRYLFTTLLVMCTMIVRWRNSLSALLLF